MQTDTSAPPVPIVCESGVVVLDGYAIGVSVNRGQLALADGIATHRRRATFAKATCKLKRLVVVGHTGSVTLDALRWLADVGAAVIQIDRDGELLFASAGQGRDDARLRRAQDTRPLPARRCRNRPIPLV